MATIRVKKADAIVFQMLRRDFTTGEDWEESGVYALAVKPASIRYAYGGRSTTVQTTPGEGFVDRFGMRPTRVNISGTFGLQMRRQGTTVKDGFTRLVEFRDEVMKRSHQARPLRSDGVARYVYAVNFYDFIHDERFAVNLEDLSIEVSARRNPFEPQYTLNFVSVGPITKVTTTDGLLWSLLAFDSILTAATDAVDAALAAVKEIPGVATGIFMADALLTGVETAGGTLETLTTLAAGYAGAISKITTRPTEALGLDKIDRFISDIKG